MAVTPSQMLALGTAAPAFSLPDPAGRVVSLRDLDGAKVLVVAFICNHCPYVKHIGEGLARFGREVCGEDVALVAINSNDPSTHPADRSEKMVEEIERLGYAFPYLVDETQEVAKAYRAACTPDFYVFDEGRRLVYRGQFDASRPNNGLPVTGFDLRAAVAAVLEGKCVAGEQRPSIGCTIKWRPGAEPDYV